MFDYAATHDVIEFTGMGNCNELADYLMVEIGEKIHKAGAHATLKVVESQVKDHVYLEITIKLQNERGYSRWEVDAWDPRIIDISTRPNGTIKNRESLDYGYEIRTQTKVNTDDFESNKKRKKNDGLFLSIRKPIAGPPTEPGTPEREVLTKHKLLYSDYTFEEAYAAKKLDPRGKLHCLQRVSFWQQSKSEDTETKYEHSAKKRKL